MDHDPVVCRWARVPPSCFTEALPARSHGVACLKGGSIVLVGGRKTAYTAHDLCKAFEVALGPDEPPPGEGAPRALAVAGHSWRVPLGLPIEGKEFAAAGMFVVRAGIPWVHNSPPTSAKPHLAVGFLGFHAFPYRCLPVPRAQVTPSTLPESMVLLGNVCIQGGAGRPEQLAPGESILRVLTLVQPAGRSDERCWEEVK